MRGATELYISSVLDQPISDLAGQVLGRLLDVAVAPGEVLPVVTGLLLKDGRRVIFIPWERVVIFNPRVISFSGGLDDHLTDGPPPGTILVRRHLLDRQIVDVNGAKVVRVNDIKLTPYEERLCLFSVDIGFRGLLRRLGYERLWSLFQKNLPKREIGWQFVNPLGINASGLTLSMARDQLADMHPSDLAEIISNLHRDSIEGIIKTLDHEVAGEAIHELDAETRTQVISQLDVEHASEILEEMQPDEAADVLADLPEEQAQELLDLLDHEEASEIQELMEHKEDTAGALMNSDFIAVSPLSTVGEAFMELKRQAAEIEAIFYVYVLDHDGYLIGVMSLRDLLIHDPALPVVEVMTQQLKTLEITDPPEEALALLAKYDLIAAPIIDQDGKMAGVVTIDDVVEMFLPYALKRKR
ncbi:MAG: CBS domain-containing protein [Desulfobacteraceae bacterium]|nr:CBS domain-containing protein [Desulfobacteraceae bacterium]